MGPAWLCGTDGPAGRRGEGRADTWALFLQQAAHSAALWAAYKAPRSRPPAGCEAPVSAPPGPLPPPGRPAPCSAGPRARQPTARPRPQLERATHLVTLVESFISATPQFTPYETERDL